MDKVSFKQYSKFMKASDAEINEGFGEFLSKTFGAKKPDQKVINKLKADRLALSKKADAKQDEIRKQKDELWAMAKDKIEGKPQAKPEVDKHLPGKPRPTPSQARLSLAASGRASERDWINNMTNESLSESAMGEIHQELQDIKQHLVDGYIDLHSIFSGQHKDLIISTPTIKFLRKLFKTTATKFRLHPDRDFDEVEEHVIDELKKQFSR